MTGRSQMPSCENGRGEIGKERRGVARARACGSPHFRQTRQQRIHAAGSGNRVPGHSDDDRHLERELEQVGPEHAPQSTQRDIETGEWNQEQNADGQSVAIAHPSVTATMLVMALVTHPRIRQFISRPR